MALVDVGATVMAVVRVTVKCLPKSRKFSGVPEQSGALFIANIGIEFMGQDGVIDANPKALSPAISKKGDQDSTETGKDECQGKGHPSDEVGKGDRQYPAEAGENVVQGNGPEPPTILLLKGKAA